MARVLAAVKINTRSRIAVAVIGLARSMAAAPWIVVAGSPLGAPTGGLD